MEHRAKFEPVSPLRGKTMELDNHLEAPNKQIEKKLPYLPIQYPHFR